MMEPGAYWTTTNSQKVAGVKQAGGEPANFPVARDLLTGYEQILELLVNVKLDYRDGQPAKKLAKNVNR